MPNVNSLVFPTMLLTVALFLAPNLSIGVALLTKLVADAAKALGLAADVEIVETHHRKKKDSPSGTALQLARAVAAARDQDLNDVASYGRHGFSGIACDVRGSSPVISTK